MSTGKKLWTITDLNIFFVILNFLVYYDTIIKLYNYGEFFVEFHKNERFKKVIINLNIFQVVNLSSKEPRRFIKRY